MSHDMTKLILELLLAQKDSDSSYRCLNGVCRLWRRYTDTYQYKCFTWKWNMEYDRNILKHIDPSANNNMAIRQASFYGYRKIVEMLLEDNRVDPSAVKNYAVIHASMRGHMDIVEMLMKDGRVDPSAQKNKAVREATANGHRKIVETLKRDGRVKLKKAHRRRG